MTDRDERFADGTVATEQGAVKMRDVLGGLLNVLRYEPTRKRVRATLGGETVVDSVRAVLVWEPRRVVPGYAVPEEDVSAQVVPSAAISEGMDGSEGYLPELSRRPVLDPRVPFAVRTTPGEAVELRTSAGDRSAAGFRPADPALAGYVILSFGDFDEWFEEDDLIISHPHDPYGRIDVRGTSRRIQVLQDGQVLADSTRARMLFETTLPTRYYLPIEDVRVPLTPTETRTTCAYKGEAAYYAISTDTGEVKDAVWTYRDPLVDATEVKNLVSFFDERFDVAIDGVVRERPRTPWS